MTAIDLTTARRLRPRRVLFGFGLSLGYTMTYLSLLVIIPLGGMLAKAASLSWADFYAAVTDRFVASALRVSFTASILAASINGVFGLIVAWVLVRYSFPGRRIFDAMIDLPFALPTAVAGLTFSVLYSPSGWIGRFGALLHVGTRLNAALHWVWPSTPIPPDWLLWMDLQFTGHYSGIVVALIFVGLPFVVRTVQPVLQDLDRDVEEAAGSLGASRFYTFRRVIFPALLPAWLAGLALSFARAVGEYGSVIFISSNLPLQTEIAPVQIVQKISEGQIDRATAIATVMLATSLGILLLINGFEWWTRRKRT